MEECTLPPPPTLFVEQEESSIMESRKRESSEWTDEKHSLYLKSMEASFVDQLYKSLDMQNRQTQNKRSSASMSCRRIHTNTRSPSGQFKVQHDGFWSRVDFTMRNEASKSHISSNNPWIRHFRKGNQHGGRESSSNEEKQLLNANLQQIPASELKLEVKIQEPSCSNTEVIDQNFVEEEEDCAVQKVNKTCSKKRKGISAVS